MVLPREHREGALRQVLPSIDRGLWISGKSLPIRTFL
jgi:hypothetical protein